MADVKILKPDQKVEYLRLLDEEEKKLQSSSWEIESAKREVQAGFLFTSQAVALIDRLTQSAKSVGGSSILAKSTSDFFSAVRNAKGSVAISYPPLNLEDPEVAAKVKNLRENGIQENGEIEFALRYIETIAPNLAKGYIEAYRSANHIQIVVDSKITNGAHTEVLLVKFFDRNAVYPLAIRMRKGATVFELFHELARHALPQDLQIDAIRNRPYPIASKDEKFGEIRTKSARALLHEEAEAYALMFLLLEEGQKKDPKLALNNPYWEKLDAVFQQHRTEGDGAGMDALMKAVPEVFPSYAEQAKVLSAIVALAGKTNKEFDPKFSPTNILELITTVSGQQITHQDGQVDPAKAAEVLYDLFKDCFPEEDQSTPQLIYNSVLKSLSTDSVKDPFELVVSILEARYDNVQYSGKQAGLMQKLQGTPDLGPRQKPINTSSDRGYLNDIEMAKSIVTSVGSYIRFIERLRQQGKVGGRDFNRSILHMALHSEDPYAGQLFGQAITLAYAQSDRYPEMLVDLGAALAEAGYVESATKALTDYVPASIRFYGTLIISKDRMRMEKVLQPFLEAVKKLPAAEQVKVLEQTVSQFDPFRLSDEHLRTLSHSFIDTTFGGEEIFEFGFDLTVEDKKEIELIVREGYPDHVDFKKFDQLFDKIAQRLKTDYQTLNEKYSKRVIHREKSSFLKKNHDVRAAFREGILRAYIGPLEMDQGIIAEGHEIMEHLYRAIEPLHLSANHPLTQKAVQLDKKLQQVSIFTDHVKAEVWKGGLIPSKVEKELEDYFPHRLKGPSQYSKGDARVNTRSEYTLYEDEVTFGLLKWDHSFEHGMKLLEKRAVLPETVDTFLKALPSILENSSTANRLRVLQFARLTIEQLAAREFTHPGITQWELYSYQSKSIDEFSTEISAKSSGQFSIPQNPKETYLYNYCLGRLIAMTAYHKDSAVGEFGQNLMSEVYTAKAQVRDASYGIQFPLKWEEGSNESPKKTDVYRPIDHRFNILMDALDDRVILKFIGNQAAHQPTDRAVLTELVRYYSDYLTQEESYHANGAVAQEESPVYHYKHRAILSIEEGDIGGFLGLLRLTNVLMVEGHEDLLKQAVSLADQWKQTLKTKAQSATSTSDRPYTTRESHYGSWELQYYSEDQFQKLENDYPLDLQRLEHAKRYVRWFEYSKGGQIDRIKSETEEFLRDLKTDLEGRGYYEANELMVLAVFLGRIPGMDNFQEKIVEQAVDRYVKLYQHIDNRENFFYAEAFINQLRKAGLKPEVQDRLFCRLIDQVAGLLATRSVKSAEEALKLYTGLRNYLSSSTDRFSQTDRKLYGYAALLLSNLESVGDRARSADVLWALSNLAGDLYKENPWLGMSSTFGKLWSANEDWGFRRELAALFPVQATQSEPIVLPNGSLNVQGMKAGFVDADKFFEEMNHRLSTESISPFEAKEIASAFIQGSLIRKGERVSGNFKEVVAALPAFSHIWKRVEKELGTQPLSPLTEALLQGAIEGLTGDSIVERPLFFAELLQNQKIPLSCKQLIWERLAKTEMVSSYADNFLKRYIRTGEHSFNEEAYYAQVGKLMVLSDGKPPRSNALALLLNHPADEAKFFTSLSKWKSFSEGKGGSIQLDVSSLYDLFFYAYYLTDNVDHALYVIAGKFDQAPNEVVKPRGGYEIHLIELDPSVRAKNKYFYHAIESYTQRASLEGEALPEFVEKFPEDLRRFFSSVIKNLDPAIRNDLFHSMKQVDQKDTGNLVRILLTKLGWVKVGQLLSSSTILPDSVREALAPLQDEVTPSTFEEIDETLRGGLGGFYEQLKSMGDPPRKFKHPPIKSGSIGEIVEARLLDGTKVAIKVITSKRRQAIDRMLSVLHSAQFSASSAGDHFVQGINISRFLDQFKEMITREMDLTLEREAIDTFGTLPKGMTMPGVIRESPPSPSVLLIEWVNGEKLSPEKIASLSSKERKVVFERLKRLLGRVFEKGIYQGDPHPGNLMQLDDGRTALLDFGQVEVVLETDCDPVVNLFLALSRTGPGRTEAVADALIEMDKSYIYGVNKKDQEYINLIKSRIDRSDLVRRVQEVLEKKRDPKQPKTGIMLELIGTANQKWIEIEASANYLFKAIATLEGTLQQLDPSFDITKELRRVVRDYGFKRYGVGAFTNWVKKGIKPKKTYPAFNRPPFFKELGFKGLQGAMNTVVGGVPFGVGELGSSFFFSLFSPTHSLPSADEMAKNFGIMSLGGGIGKLTTDGIINKIEGKSFLAAEESVAGEISIKGAARRFVPLLAAMLLDDWVHGRPIEAGKTALGMGNVAIAAGLTHAIGSGLRKATIVEKAAQWLRLVKAGAAVGAPESGGTTLLGACVASIVEFTILKGIGAAEESYVNYRNKEEVQEVYSQAIKRTNDLVKDIKAAGLNSINQERILAVRSDLEKAAAYYHQYFQSRISALEIEREKQRKELETDRREYLLDRSGRSVFEINQMYDEKIAKLNKAFSEEIGEIKGAESVIEFRRIPLTNLRGVEQKKNIEEKEISTTDFKPLTTERLDEIATQAVMFSPLTDILADNEDSFIAQHEKYVEELKGVFQQALDKEMRNNPEFAAQLNSSFSLNQTVH